MSFLFTSKTLRLNNLDTRTGMNAKISVLAICGQAIIYLLLYNLLGYTFNKRVNAEAAAHCCSVAVLNYLNILIEAAVCRYSSNRSF